jgi:hypothetical protein
VAPGPRLCPFIRGSRRQAYRFAQPRLWISHRGAAIPSVAARYGTIDWPFRASEALDAGALTFRELRRFHSAIYPGVWAPRGVELSAKDRARAAWLWSRRRGVVSGLSAAALLGAKWIEPELPAELIHVNRRSPQNVVVHTDELADDIAEVIGRHPGLRGVRQLREMLALVDGGDMGGESGRSPSNTTASTIGRSAGSGRGPHVIVDRVGAALVSRGCPSLVSARRA